MPLNITERLLWQMAKLGRLRFWYLASHLNPKVVSALFIFFACAVSMLILGTAAYITSWPMIFPSLGPTIFLMFYAPASPMASPRNAVLGHLSAAVIGWVMHSIYLYLVAKGLIAESGHGVSFWEIATSACSLGLTGMFMTFTGLLHPPAASSTMIASLGLMRDWHNIPILITAVSLLSLQAWIMHRFHGIKFPAWSPARSERGPRIQTKLGEVHFSKGRPTSDVEELADRLVARRKGAVKRNGKGAKGRI